MRSASELRAMCSARVSVILGEERLGLPLPLRRSRVTSTGETSASIAACFTVGGKISSEPSTRPAANSARCRRLRWARARYCPLMRRTGRSTELTSSGTSGYLNIAEGPFILGRDETSLSGIRAAPVASGVAFLFSGCERDFGAPFAPRARGFFRDQSTRADGDRVGRLAPCL